MGFYLRQWLRPWKATPWQSGFHFLVLAIALAMLLLALQVGVRSHFEIPATLQTQPRLVTTAAFAEQQQMMPLPLLLVRELAKQPQWQWASPLMWLFKVKPTWQGQPLPKGFALRLVGRELFAHLQLQMALGRGFSPQPEQAAREVLLSHDLWQQWFSGRRDVLQQVIEVDGQSFQVKGVLPAGFRGFSRQNIGLWFSVDMLDLPAPGHLTGMERLMYRMRDRTPGALLLGQLRPGYDVAGWNQALRAFQNYQPPPLLMDGRPVQLTSKLVQGQLQAWPGLDALPEASRRTRQLSQLMLWISASLTALVLAGILLFLLEKLPERLQEFRLRYSLGASPGQIFRQLAMENLLFFLPVLPLAWGLLWGLFQALAGIEPFQLMIPGRIPPPDFILLLWAVAGLLALAWLMAALPARYLGARLVDQQRHQTRARGWVWLGWGLNSLQLSAAFVAVLLALLFAGGVFALSRTGWVAQNESLKVLSWRCRGFNCGQVSLNTVMDAMGGQTAAQVVATGFRPLGPALFAPVSVQLPQQPDQRVDIPALAADARLFTLPGMPRVLAGHLPGSDEHDAVLASRSAVKRLGWSVEQAVGQTLVLAAESGKSYRIAAVVEDENLFDPRVPAGPVLWFRPGEPAHAGLITPTLLWQGPQNPTVLRARLQDALTRLGLEARSVRVETLAERAEALLGDDLRFARMVLLAAGFSLLVALLGIYASVLFALQRDRRALGIHLAFGATPARLLQRALTPYLWLSLLALLMAGAVSGLLSDSLRPWLLLLQAQLPGLLSITVLLLALMVAASLLAGARRLILTQPRALLQEE